MPGEEFFPAGWGPSGAVCRRPGTRNDRRKMIALMPLLFVGGYLPIALENRTRIDFVWYLKRVSLLALIGYLAGIGVFLCEKMLLRI